MFEADFIAIPTEEYRTLKRKVIAMEALEDTFHPYKHMTFEEVLDWQDEFYTKLEAARRAGEDI